MFFARAVSSSSQSEEALKKSKLDLGRSEAGVVTMYVCGPTVYDAAHLGHARTYVQFDVIRRILHEVHGLQVAFFMNVTDVDDKILDRSRANKLALDNAQKDGDDEVAKSIGETSWRDLARKFEGEFFRDMRRLGVQPPTYAPRATENVENMIQHIQDLVNRGLAYVGANTGSVYFSTTSFDKEVSDFPEFKYGAMDPSRQGGSDGVPVEADPDAGPFAGTTLAGGVTSEKRSAKDFALWKCIPDAPSNETWPSPWGQGRPGWHAECAVMIKHTAGTVRQDGRLDIHGGGIDLRFPHHENERAQSQACCGSHPWTSHFLHTGHLHISGRKMSKSLKNFITIEQLLNGPASELPAGFSPLTPREMRLLFLNVRYNLPMELTPDATAEAKKIERSLEDTFTTVNLAVSSFDSTQALKPWGPKDTQLLAGADSFRVNFRQALMDDFNTPSALLLLREFASEIRSYIQENNAQPVVAQQAIHQVRIGLEILGIGGSDPYNLPGYGSLSSLSSGTNPGGYTGDLKAESIVDVLVDFRTAVRDAAKNKNIGGVFKEADRIRDVVLPSLGVRIVDREGISTWSPCAPVVQTCEGVMNDTETKTENNEKKKGESDPEPQTPQEMFRSSEEEASKYSAFDDDGVPTHDADGEPLSKSALKKLRKKWTIQKTKYDRWLERSNKSV